METRIAFKGCLFDLDGTLIDSYPAVIRNWTQLALKHGLDPDYVFSVIHGRPARESIYELLDGHDVEFIEQQVTWLETQESLDTEGVVPLTGTIEFLNQLNQHNIPWAIVTSGTYPVASARIKAANLPTPPQLVTADLITNGKPDPEPFLLGAEKIGIDIKDCIVFEDAPAGVQAGIASGAKVVGILSHHELDKQYDIATTQDLAHVAIEKDSHNYALTL
jgi:sugar-phosphatase